MIGASSAGTIIEWYDFYLYGVLAAFLAPLFFPKGNATASLLASLATFGAGFAVRPFGAAFFGRIGDLIGRKFTFLMTITVMGLSTALSASCPTYAQIGILAPIILVTLRLAQGLALGGEYGGAAIYVAEHCPTPSAARTRPGSRRPRRSACCSRWSSIGDHARFDVRRGLHELRLAHPVPPLRLPGRDGAAHPDAPAGDAALHAAQGGGQVVDARRGATRFGDPQPAAILLALLGVTAGQAVVWYQGQFQALFFLGTNLASGSSTPT